MRHIKIFLSTPYVGTDAYRYLHTDMSDSALWEFLEEEAVSYNESFGYEFNDWMDENATDTPEDEWPDYWDDYVCSVTECCAWEEMDAEEIAEIGADEWEEI